MLVQGVLLEAVRQAQRHGVRVPVRQARVWAAPGPWHCLQDSQVSPQVGAFAFSFTLYCPDNITDGMAATNPMTEKLIRKVITGHRLYSEHDLIFRTCTSLT